MANGSLVPSQARWEGMIQLMDVTIKGSFEVFDSGGSWAFLLGKPLLRRLKARQNFGSDTVEIEANDGSVTILQNDLSVPKAFEPSTEGVSLTLDVKQLNKPPAEDLTETQPVFVMAMNEAEDSILTRDTDPFKAERVAQILREITIGSDVTSSQRDEICKLISDSQTALHSQSKKLIPYQTRFTSSTYPKEPHFGQKYPHDHTTQTNARLWRQK